MESPDDVPAIPAILTDDRPCLSCGYNLRGLTHTGVCPECGTSIARSLRGNLLKYSGADYLRQLHNGAILVQASLIFHILTAIVGFVAAILAPAARAASPNTPAIHIDAIAISANLGALTSSLMTLAGWWLLSAPDPGVIGSETGTDARKIVRASVVIYCAAAAGAALLAIARVAPFNRRNPQFDAAHLLPVIMAAFGFVAWAVWFFAAMRYLRWLSPRIPNFKARDRAKLLSWLGPVLYIFGCGIGQLVALVMYYNLLDWIRMDVRAIRAEQARES